MARFRLIRKNTPARKVPVISTKAPMINGPLNPPISATQKNIPPAEPMYLEPTSGVSINVSSSRGRKQELAIPNRINPARRVASCAVTTTNRATTVNKANKATKRPLKYAGTRRGMTRVAGMPAASGMAAAKPA